MHEPTTVIRAVCRVVCGEGNRLQRGTAFLISSNRVVTATHTLSSFFENQSSIILQFLNVTNYQVIERIARPLNNIDNDHSAVTVLEFDDPMTCDYLKFTKLSLEQYDDYETYGYPVIKWDMGRWEYNKVSRIIKEDMFQPFDWDLDLDHDSNIGDFSGLSGAPLIVKGYLVGVLLTQSLEKERAVSLGAISVQRFVHVLENLRVSIDSTEEINYTEIHEPPQSGEYKDFIFIEKLESANIFEHEMCQKEFYNADILKSVIESKGIPQEVAEFKKLKENIHNVWFTQYVSYKDENDGSELLSIVYGRVEDLDSKVLATDKRITLYAKKGILHHLSEDCSVGWVKNYKKKLMEFQNNKREASK